MIDLQQRLIEAPQPIELVYSVLHSMCTNLALMSIVYPQAYAMRDGYWKGKMKIESLYEGKPLSDLGHGSNKMSDGIRLWYWLGSERERERKQSPSSLTIQIDQKQNLVVTHSSKLYCPWQVFILHVCNVI